VWHWIAFIVIGLVIGWLFSRGSSKPVLVIVLGLIGGLVGGLAIIYGVGQQHYIIVKYGSIIVSIVLALILAFLGRGSKKA
jgi:uncharacterized membrane protein YeaQ/YmgE (transglycosylase-associated protein family)